ncbi:hypothetical protein SEA_SPEEDDEMON_530 [Gordonia phage SpeedDemon]|nr:hypothetical protein SEA_SPEEDDEMON_530 [Gordonia phage SpeedDemon]
MTDTTANLIEGWAPMHNTQRSFHFYREKEADEAIVRSLCGKWGLTRHDLKHFKLEPYKPGALHISPDDCLGCSRKLRANEKKES